MIYYTGDIHGKKSRIVNMCKEKNLTKNDTIIILGDVGANYYGGKRDIELKKSLSALPPTILCIHGNHEMRPATIPTYQLMDWKGGKVWGEKEFPNLLFARDGEIFDIEGIRHLVIGGAYSVDKFFRIAYGYGWWPDEQPSEETKRYVEVQVQENSIDVILSHTCPYRFIPTEALLPGIDQNYVDNSTEKWLDTIEQMAKYTAWACGHWHIDKPISKIHFLYHSFLTSKQLLGEEGVTHE